jgi:hypothetical protein
MLKILIVVLIILLYIISTQCVEKFDSISSIGGNVNNPMDALGVLLTKVQSGNDPYGCNQLLKNYIENPQSSTKDEDDARLAAYYTCLQEQKLDTKKVAGLFSNTN